MNNPQGAPTHADLLLETLEYMTWLVGDALIRARAGNQFDLLEQRFAEIGEKLGDAHCFHNSVKATILEAAAGQQLAGQGESEHEQTAEDVLDVSQPPSKRTHPPAAHKAKGGK